jgi:hypothetical protein
VVVGRGTKCCGSEPRCRTCPVRLLAELRADLPQAGDVPAHLAGVPRCLHKYEPLFRAPAEASPPAEPVT